MGANLCIVDDHLIFCQGLKAILHTQSIFNVKGIFSSALSFIEFLETSDQIDLVTVDLMMPEMDGIQLLSYLRRNRPEIRSLVIADSYNKNTFQLCQNMGVDGILPKNLGSKDVIQAIEQILANQKYFPSFDWKKIRTEEQSVYDRLRDQLELSPRELEVIQLLLNQFETQDIANRLGISPHTIKTHRKNIYSKMKVNNLAGVFHFIQSQGDYPIRFH